MKREIVTLFGRVQGVGFRDAVVDLASRYPVAGTVRNVRDGERLAIDVEGGDNDVDAFIAHVLAEPPRLARVERVDRVAAAPTGARGFRRERTI